MFGTEILGVGIAYKPDVADDRESASVAVLDELARRGAVVSVIDPVLAPSRIEARGFNTVHEGEDLSRFALAAVLTDHSALDLEGLSRAVPVVFDARGAYRRAGLSPGNVVAL